jgi:hypothetical protein
MLRGFFKEGDFLQGCWGEPCINGEETGATVGFDGVTEIIVDKADGPMGFYAVARVMRGDEIWMVLPLHLMQSVEVSPRENSEAE